MGYLRQAMPAEIHQIHRELKHKHVSLQML
jgi:hypothetical protein